MSCGLVFVKRSASNIIVMFPSQFGLKHLLSGITAFQIRFANPSLPTPPFCNKHASVVGRSMKLFKSSSTYLLSVAFSKSEPGGAV